MSILETLIIIFLGFVIIILLMFIKSTINIVDEIREEKLTGVNEWGTIASGGSQEE